MQNLVCSYKLEVHSTLRHKICDCDPGDRGLNNFNIYLRIIAFLSKNIFRCGTCWENYEKKFPIHAFVRPLLCEDPTLSPAVTAWTFDLQNSPLRLLKIFPIIFTPPPLLGGHGLNRLEFSSYMYRNVLWAFFWPYGSSETIFREYISLF